MHLKLANSILYTVGTSNRTKEAFLEILKFYNIKTAVDVRSFSKSRFKHFTKENLRLILKENGFNYIDSGKELGGFRKGGYPAYTETLSFKEGISRLEGICNKGTVAFMCAEKLPWKCHRLYIALSLEKRGWQVVHILDKGTVWE
ncbi:MAG: DUF488 domain-containing protein [Thermodesulfobacteriota bacterium]|nr:DUF488 domain-containing protein [Thermodesulfobacteriota bacterium]